MAKDTGRNGETRASENGVSRRSSSHRSGGSTAKKKKKRTPGQIILLSVRNVILALLLVCLMVGLIVAGIVAGALFGYVETIDPIDMDKIRLNMTSFVYGTDAEGNTHEVQRLYDNENRIWVDLDDIPKNLQDAFISIEDERFWSHKGVDIKRTFGATATYLYGKIKGTSNRTFGGSTITQQLIKNLTGEKDYDPKRKIQEIYRAFKLETELSKQEILEYYLNTIFLGQQCNGVSSAANTYFGKPVSELTLAECASIAGITQSPTKYDPYQNRENNKARQEVVLGKMLELGKITQSQYDDAVAEKLDFSPAKTEEEVSYQSYYVDATINQIIDDLIEKYGYTKDIATRVLFNGGLRIYLAQDETMQKILDDVYADPSSFQKASGEVQPQSAMAIMDPYTGQVKALCGGRGEKEGNLTLNRATQALRQPGSTIKPIGVYGPALEYGLITPSTIVNDSPVTFHGWSPRNADRSFRGNITVRSALAGSRNVPATKICSYLGVNNSFKFMTQRMHISSLDEVNDMDYAPLALGGLTHGVSVLEMTAAYCSFVNDGFYNKPRFYTKVLDANGNLVLEGTATHEIAMSETAAADMLSMMKDSVRYGTSTMANFSGMAIAGKTGTTGSEVTNDRWFVGCTPYYVAAVWFGYDQPKSLRGFYSNPAALVWKKVMQPIHKGLEYRDFNTPGKNGKEVSVMMCEESGQRANPDCEHVVSEMYAKNKVPTKRCELHPMQGGSKSILSSGKATGTTQPKTTNTTQNPSDTSGDDDKTETGGDAGGTTGSTGTGGNTGTAGTEGGTETPGTAGTAGTGGGTASGQGGTGGTGSGNEGGGITATDIPSGGGTTPTTPSGGGTVAPSGGGTTTPTTPSGGGETQTSEGGF